MSEKEISKDYIGDITARVKISKPLSVVVDCGNATGGPIAPVVLEKVGVKVERLFCDIDPKFPNHPPDPVDPRAYPKIVEKIKAGKYDAGLVFDGDADRLGVVDSNCNIIRGDQITALCARKILNEKKGAKILFEVQCSKSAIDDVKNHGGEPLMVRVGHSYIEEALLREKGELAGETSGHLFFADRWWGFDDAVYAACRFLEYVAESGKTVTELVDSMPKYVSTPQTRLFAPDERKFKIVEELKQYFGDLSSRNLRQGKGYFRILTIDGVRLEWPDGWAVVRASNTQPQLTLRAEATSKKRLSEIQKVMEEALAPYSKEGVKVEWGKVG